MEDWIFQLIQNFIIGGFVIASVSYLATFLDPVLAAIWWSFPISLLPSMYYMYTQGKDFKYIGRFTMTTTYALIVLFFTTFAIGYFYNREKNNFWMPILKGVGVWILLSSIYYIGIRTLGLEKKFM